MPVCLCGERVCMLSNTLMKEVIMKTVKFALRARAATPSVFSAVPEEFTISDGDGLHHYIKVGGFNERIVTSGTIDGAQVTLTGDFFQDITYSMPVQIAGQRFIALDRYPKAVYNGLLNSVGKKLSNFLPTLVWNNPGAFIPRPERSYLLRPKAGARGMGFINLNTGKSIQYVLQTLALHASKSPEDYLQALAETGIVLSDEGMNDTHDLVATVNTGYDVVEFIPNVTAEYRIMTDYTGQPVLVVERTRTMTKAGFHQARGCGQSVDKAVPFKDWEPSGDAGTIKAQLVDFFTTLARPVNSFDLFITEQGEWGFFEACSEFGSTSLPDGWLAMQARQLVHHTATCCL